MSEPDGRRQDPQRAADQLCQQPGAVIALLALYTIGGSANLGQLTYAHPETPIASALRWLTAQRLVRRDGDAGSIDNINSCTIFSLTMLGEALTSSVTALAALAEQVTQGPKSRNARWSRPPRPFRSSR